VLGEFCMRNPRLLDDTAEQQHTPSLPFCYSVRQPKFPSLNTAHCWLKMITAKKPITDGFFFLRIDRSVCNDTRPPDANSKIQKRTGGFHAQMACGRLC
jgi:hypothetical protein